MPEDRRVIIVTIATYSSPDAIPHDTETIGSSYPTALETSNVDIVPQYDTEFGCHSGDVAYPSGDIALAKRQYPEAAELENRRIDWSIAGLGAIHERGNLFHRIPSQKKKGG